MGKVNEYIDKIINIVKSKTISKDKPWLQYYNDMPEKIDYYSGSMYDFIKKTAGIFPNNIAYEYFGQRTTYKNFIKKIDKVANSLRALNVVENECITICLPNTPEAVILIYACNKVGAIANIVHPLSSKMDIEKALKETNSSILFCSDVSMKITREIKVDKFIFVPVSNEFSKLLRRIYNIKNKLNFILEDNMISWESFIDKESNKKDISIKRIGDDPAAIIYSGGTTGKSKGIIISNKNFNAMAQQTAWACKEVIPGHSILSALPIFHVFGLAVCIHVPLCAGMKCIIVPKLNTKAFNKAIKKNKPNVLPVVPSLLKIMINDRDPGKNAFKCIKAVPCGGDFLSDEAKEDANKYLKNHGSNATIKVGYGLSEATGFCLSTYDNYNVSNGIGIPNPDTIVKIFEPKRDVELPFGEIGEICINGPTVMMGYINEDKETCDTLKIHSDNKVWLHTGDLGRMEKDGIFHYVSRLKRMIITNGYNIYPLEIEQIINKNHFVESCVVIGVPDEMMGQIPKVVIVLKKGIVLSQSIKQEIKKYCINNIAKYAIPKIFEFRDSLPLTKVGKVAFNQLKETN